MRTTNLILVVNGTPIRPVYRLIQGMRSADEQASEGNHAIVVNADGETLYIGKRREG